MAHRIIIVDDDQVTLRLLEKTISDAGFEVLTAVDGMKGLDLIQTTSPAIAIIDMLIPKLHGVEVCKRIRDNELLHGTKIILMSAVYQFSTFRRDIEHADADYFVNKPIDVPKLLELIKGILPTSG
ncbi:MAG: response regulator [Candidatus Aminicenantes bacterium]|nr:response regulator [Candidatus Aminicenantes bacterium]